MLISGMSNGRSLSDARQTIQTLRSAPDPAARLQALLALQQQISHYEDRVAHQPPLWTRFGLNQDASILAALWPPYAAASKSILVTPIQQNLEATLVDLSQMPTESLDDQANAAAQEGHKALKTYLMLAEPSRVDSSFITPQLMRYWSTNANVSVGAKLDISERLAGFYAQHLKAHDAWRIQPRPELVNASRRTLLSVIGVRNSEDTVYQSVLAGVGNKYPDQSLASLTAGTDTRGLIRTSVTVPGVYTRQAYEGYVASAITEAAKSRDVTRDWVLANNDASANAVDPAQTSSTDALELALTMQYFNDYAEHWRGFMNALQWQPAPNIPAAIEQMKLLADARQSPVIALMKSLDYQGNAGIRQASLSDTIVAKAQNIFGKKDDPQAATVANDAGPLSASFGPVLRLIGRDGDSTAKTNAPASDVSLQRYLERVTALRLKLQQLSNGTDGDAQARQLAQALFQGKGSELADTVTEFHPVWIQLNEFEPTALGENCVLGRGFYDRGNCARVVISPTTPESVLGLTPGRQMHSEIMALLRFYLGYESNAHLEMHVSPDLMPRADIASDQVRLGYTSQLQQVKRPYETGAITRVQLGTWDGRTANTRTTH